MCCGGGGVGGNKRPFLWSRPLGGAPPDSFLRDWRRKCCKWLEQKGSDWLVRFHWPRGSLWWEAPLHRHNLDFYRQLGASFVVVENITSSMSLFPSRKAMWAKSVWAQRLPSPYLQALGWGSGPRGQDGPCPDLCYSGSLGLGVIRS